MQARGQAGSGAELAATLAGSQAAAEMEAEQSDRIAAEANKRALQAIMAGGTLGGQVRNADMDASTTRARAEDELNRFNVNNKLAVNSRNTAAMNTAAQRNLSEKQRLDDANTAMGNQEKLRQNEALRQVWLDKLSLAEKKSANYKDQSASYAGRAQDTRDTVGGIGKSVGEAASGIFEYANRPKVRTLTPLDEDEELKTAVLPATRGTGYIA
jgi:hypothetical protein